MHHQMHKSTTHHVTSVSNPSRRGLTYLDDLEIADSLSCMYIISIVVNAALVRRIQVRSACASTSRRCYVIARCKAIKNTPIEFAPAESFPSVNDIGPPILLRLVSWNINKCFITKNFSNMNLVENGLKKRIFFKSTSPYL